jgi:hypothetical protein
VKWRYRRGKRRDERIAEKIVRRSIVMVVSGVLGLGDNEEGRGKRILKSERWKCSFLKFLKPGFILTTVDFR